MMTGCSQIKKNMFFALKHDCHFVLTLPSTRTHCLSAPHCAAFWQNKNDCVTVFRSVTANLGTCTHLNWVCWVILNSKTNSGYPTPQIKEEMFTTTPDVWAQTSAVNQCRDFGVAICKDENAWLWIWMSLLRGNPNLIRWLAIVNRDIWSCQTGVITHMTTRYKQRPF